jgi:hypothetical protein
MTCRSRSPGPPDVPPANQRADSQHEHRHERPTQRCTDSQAKQDTVDRRKARTVRVVVRRRVTSVTPHVDPHSAWV